MKSNRAAKRLLEVSIWAYDGAYRLSNRKREFCNEDGEQQVITESSRRQRRAEQRRFKWLRENADYSCDYAQVEAKL